MLLARPACPDLPSVEGAEAGWAELVSTLPQIVWVARPDGYHTYFNQQWLDYTGLTLAESLGDGWNPPFHPDDRPLSRRLWAEATRTGQPYEIEYRLRRHDGVYRWMLGRAVPMRDDTGAIVKWFGTCTDIEDLKAALEEAATLREELERRATHDPLTGLANRDLLFEQMDLMLHRRQGAGLAVVFIDLDWFKAINDRLGHRIGDQLLVVVADRLRAAVRPGDVAARIGGDEFVVVGAADDQDEAERLARRITEAVGGSVRLEGVPISVTASVGVTFVEAGEAPSADLVLAQADARMYEAKRRR
ncbi:MULTISPECIES: sensor domain-containing diguanylate cyclase [unclassified Actinotalea]|uniref:sensor domain-containing diguanylate cyclase n=1 Tax=unclassified Actinotalea TaxID=2638618 RepID=UPI0015F5EFAB|nr:MULTISPECIES: sensor domain-containing diguanylate cyclase [unclassified Actinotalea]